MITKGCLISTKDRGEVKKKEIPPALRKRLAVKERMGMNEVLPGGSRVVPAKQQPGRGKTSSRTGPAGERFESPAGRLKIQADWRGEGPRRPKKRNKWKLKKFLPCQRGTNTFNQKGLQPHGEKRTRVLQKTTSNSRARPTLGGVLYQIDTSM